MGGKGDVVIWGRYPQRGDEIKQMDQIEDRVEPLEWIVLEQRGDRVLCLSKYLLDCRAYHDTFAYVEWAESSLREWLNGAFLDRAFSKEEQRRILVTEVHNPGRDTQDQVFLLSCDEAEKYMEFEERGGQTTGYARAKGAWFLPEGEERYGYYGSWWLRYSGREWDDREAASLVISCVNYDGYIEDMAEEVNGGSCSVRPAFWLKL